MAKKQTRATENDTITETLNIDGDEVTVVRAAPKNTTRKRARAATKKEDPTDAQGAPTSSSAPEGNKKGKARSAPDTGADVASSAKRRKRKAAPSAKATKKDRAPAAKKSGTTTTKRPGKKAPALPLADLAERFLQHLEAIGKSRATVFSYSIDLGVATRAFGGDTDARTINKEQIAEFFASDRVTKTRTGKAKSELTINKTRRVARQAFEWAAAEGMIDSSPIPADAVPTRKRKAKDTSDAGGSAA